MVKEDCLRLAKGDRGRNRLHDTQSVGLAAGLATSILIARGLGPKGWAIMP